MFQIPDNIRLNERSVRSGPREILEGSIQLDGEATLPLPVSSAVVLEKKQHRWDGHQGPPIFPTSTAAPNGANIQATLVLEQPCEPFGALVVTRPRLNVGERNVFHTYAINPQVIRDWMGDKPLIRVTESLQVPLGYQLQSAANKSIQNVYEMTIRYAPAKHIVEKERKGPTTMYWAEPEAGNEFYVSTTTWI